MAELAFKEYIFKKGSKTTVYLYQSSIEIIHHGFLGKFNKIKLIQFKNISNVNLKNPGLASNGHIVLDCGKNQNKNEKHENTIEFSKIEKDLALDLKITIENKIDEIKGQRIDSTIDNFDKLKKLKELKDLEILSEDEYLEQKERIIEG
ncbi:hypothetical protein [Metabacillus sediminilitoris]|uniref:SHOCT domain-containing protein n=1 Tax=Metabacillus sediminilitoris TaxID=2567941 RepID=A0A4S4BMN6_9BACI|nr:hypothetical protein [Metabacillus sediminilitoris]QGQ46624.1 hypothetical protein GMB29_16200 [Metabacillus sediminilitoris]THF76021.1 hypothetical protein E6W99_22705 [Metabacillus sediminilitoris]